MRLPKLVFSSGRFLFYRRFLCCRTIGGFPNLPRALGDVEIPPFLVGSGKLLHDDHSVCVGDQVVHPFVLGLCIFKFIDKFQDALDIEMIALYIVFVEQGHLGNGPPRM